MINFATFKCCIVTFPLSPFGENSRVKSYYKSGVFVNSGLRFESYYTFSRSVRINVEKTCYLLINEQTLSDKKRVDLYLRSILIIL